MPWWFWVGMAWVVGSWMESMLDAARSKDDRGEVPPSVNVDIDP